MTELLGDALSSYLSKMPKRSPPDCGAFDSWHSDTAMRQEDLIASCGTSPFDVPTVRTKATTEDILEAVRESRERG